METAQQHHNRISLMRVESGLDYLRRKKQEKDLRCTTSFANHLPNSTMKPVAYVYPLHHPSNTPFSYPANLSHSGSGHHVHLDYSRGHGPGINLFLGLLIYWLSLKKYHISYDCLY